MKKKICSMLVVLMSVVLLVGCGKKEENAQGQLTGVVKTGGSTSVEKVMNALIYQFQNDNRGVTINYEPNGSGDGIKNTLSGLYEIGHSSRDLKEDGSEDGLTKTAYAIDGIAVVISNENEVSSLTKEQLVGIYTGEITNWSEVGGKDVAISVITRESGSGTRDAFAEVIGLEKGGSNIISSANTADNTGAIQTQVASNPNAIGYMSFSDVDKEKVKTVEYEGVSITTETLKDGTYKLKREFFILTKTGEELTKEAQVFIDFVMSEAGQKIVEDNKLLPTK